MIKTKMQLAHEMALAIQGTKLLHDMELVSDMAWKYADAMQAEADKRECKERPEVLQEEWQPDWSQAPENMTHFAVDKNGSGWFFSREPYTESDCCWYCGDDSVELDNHNYQGNWKESLRRRP